VAWYVFYTRKLRDRLGSWKSSFRPRWNISELWRYATTVPVGFLVLVTGINVIVAMLSFSLEPLAQTIRKASGLNFFYIHTFAHILFGIGAPKRAAEKTVTATK
jgi:hypothetical protein